jgi:hypothetical protein
MNHVGIALKELVERKDHPEERESSNHLAHKDEEVNYPVESLFKIQLVCTNIEATQSKSNTHKYEERRSNSSDENVRYHFTSLRSLDLDLHVEERQKFVPSEYIEDYRD